ncbi:hypothetical protein SEVIR_5G138100v4 [Setaria viridis]|nr:uncharacterized protein LOC117854591 isoform X3 [Setaria viridis]
MRWLGFSNAPPSRSGGGALAWRAAGGSKSLGYIFWNVDKRMSSTLIGSCMDESDESESASTSNKGQYFFVWYKRKLETTGDATHTKDRAREKEDLYLVIHDSFFFY